MPGAVASAVVRDPEGAFDRQAVCRPAVSRYRADLASCMERIHRLPRLPAGGKEGRLLDEPGRFDRRTDAESGLHLRALALRAGRVEGAPPRRPRTGHPRHAISHTPRHTARRCRTSSHSSSSSSSSSKTDSTPGKNQGLTQISVHANYHQRLAKGYENKAKGEARHGWRRL